MGAKPSINPKTGKVKPLSMREKAVVDKFVSPNSKTYANKTQSVIESGAYNVTTPMSAANIGNEIFNRPHVAYAVTEILKANDHDYDVRLREVSNLAKPQVEVITSTTTSRDGSTTTTVTERPLSPKTRLEAHKLLFKLDGSDDMRRAEASVMSDAMRNLSKRMLREKVVTGTQKDTGDGLGGDDAPLVYSIPSPFEMLDTKVPGGPSGAYKYTEMMSEIYEKGV